MQDDGYTATKQPEQVDDSWYHEFTEMRRMSFWRSVLDA